MAINTYDFNNERTLRAAFAAISELLLNISHHAYSDECTSQNDLNWKVVTSTLDDNLVSIVVEDYGITIPASVVRKIKLVPIDEAKLSDSSLIKEAVSPQIMKLDNGRGLGLRSIVKSVENDDIDNFMITSRDGVFHYKRAPEQSLLRERHKVNGTKAEIIICGVEK